MPPASSDPQSPRCENCTDRIPLGFDFTMAFQPIVNVRTREVFAHEALVRGLANEPAGRVFESVNDGNRYRFDQTCRTKAIHLAAKLANPTRLSINFMPNAVYRPDACLRTTLRAAEAANFPIERIIFEITEGERIDDVLHVREIVAYYKSRGFLTALDDFGAGYSGLNLLADLQTDLIKLDMALLRGIDTHLGRRAIVNGVVTFCREMGTTVIAEGVETREEFHVLADMGIDLFQGYYFARPAFEALPTVPPERFEMPSIPSNGV